MSGKQLFTGGTVVLILLYFAIVLFTFMRVKYELAKSNRNMTPTELRRHRIGLRALLIFSTIPLVNMLLIPAILIANLVFLVKHMYDGTAKTLRELFRKLPE